MSKSLTKIELVQINTRLAAENSALRAELSELRVQRIADQRPAPTGSWAERAAFARAEAVRTGKAVRV